MTRMILNRFSARTFAYSILVATYYLVNIGCDDLEYDQRESSSDTGCHDYTQVIDSLDRKHGSISSPNFQSSCPLDVVRRYHFKGTPEERVQLAFTEMRMEVEEQDGSSNCEHGDYIKVSVLLKKTMREIDTYCGIKKPPTLMSSENEMEVNYVRRSSTNKPGVAFTANYSFVTDFGIRSGIQVKTNPNIACMFEYHSDRSSNGTFTSPNYPGLYPRNTECHYIFHGKPNERIYIHFIYFDVEGNQLCSDESQSDYVELSNFNIPLIDRKMLRLCGLKPANKNEVNSDGDFFRVTFKSNDIYDSTGFQAFYQFRQTKAEQFTLPKKERISSTGSSISLNFPGILSYFCFVCYNIIVVPLI